MRPKRLYRQRPAGFRWCHISIPRPTRDRIKAHAQETESSIGALIEAFAETLPTYERKEADVAA